jgi:hypothetical protein
MITPELKDKLLEYVIITGGDKLHFSCDQKKLAPEFETSCEILDVIFEQFHKRGFIKYSPYAGWSCSIDVKAPAHDYYGMGGHVGEFTMLERNFEKLKMELLQLETNYSKEKVRDVQSVANTLISFFGMYYHR